mmetsp:Transcript_9505/g.15555  ORF Transcript_9505/g.15555 Transcript_9505/m.15555 type:complete len:121 (-) Transcript_9505:694-1056(-)
MAGCILSVKLGFKTQTTFLQHQLNVGVGWSSSLKNSDLACHEGGVWDQHSHRLPVLHTGQGCIPKIDSSDLPTLTIDLHCVPNLERLYCNNEHTSEEIGNQVLCCETKGKARQPKTRDQC